MFLTNTPLAPVVEVAVDPYVAPAISPNPRREAALLFDLTLAAPDHGAHSSALRMLLAGLNVVRRALPRDDWRDFCGWAQAHPLVAALKADPFIARVNDKPRGYAGDAVMIDLIYRTGASGAIVAKASALGQAVHAQTMASESSTAVRERRAVLARLVDATAAATPRPHILALAAGHLREADQSTAFADGSIGSWTALDQDPASIAEIERCFGNRITTIAEPISALLTGAVSIAPMDLIYAAGLYDYLPQRLAQRLTRKLAQGLRPGGRLLFANFADDILDAGFMEAIMDWHLILRSPADMRAIADAAGPGFAVRHWTGAHNAIHYCELVRT